jgi:hypothetical protein
MALPWDDAVCSADERPFIVLARGGSHSGASKASGGRTHVRGYTKKDGTYVAPHRRTGPDGSKSNNWSTKGSVNPDTGKRGTKDL